jgi:hypothetical protein
MDKGNYLSHDKRVIVVPPLHKSKIYPLLFFYYFFLPRQLPASMDATPLHVRKYMVLERLNLRQNGQVY